MKKIILTVGTLLAIMSASYAQSNVILTNSVTGNGNTTSIQQTIQAAFGFNNNASITVLGNDNTAMLKQDGGGLVSTTTQSGNDNQSDVSQMGSYSANSVFQTGTNDGKNVSVVISDGQGIVSQVHQQADGAGSSNNMKLSQTGNNSYAGSQQYATNRGVNSIDWEQTDNFMGIGSQANLLQVADGAGSTNTLIGSQAIGFAEGYATAEFTQTATNGGANVALVLQPSIFSAVYGEQTADGTGSSNFASIDQSGDIEEFDFMQTAMAGGTNEAQVLQYGFLDF